MREQYINTAPSPACMGGERLANAGLMVPVWQTKSRGRRGILPESVGSDTAGKGGKSIKNMDKIAPIFMQEESMPSCIKMGVLLLFPTPACPARQHEPIGGYGKADFLCLHVPAQFSQGRAQHIGQHCRLEPSRVGIYQKKQGGVGKEAGAQLD